MNTHRWVWASLVLALLTIGCVAAARPQPAAKSDTFTLIAKRAQKAVIRGDWRALQRDSEPEICLAQYMRGYTQELTQKQVRERWPRILFTEQEFDNGAIEELCVSYKLINTRKPLDRASRITFKEFCELVKYSWTTEEGINEISLRNPGGEVDGIIGPAVSGINASNVHWRIELSRNTGRWRVSRLVLELH